MVPPEDEEPTKPFVVLLALMTRCKLLRQIPRSRERGRPFDGVRMPVHAARVDERGSRFPATEKKIYFFGGLFIEATKGRRPARFGSGRHGIALARKSVEIE